MALFDAEHNVTHVAEIGDGVAAQDEKAGFAALLKAAEHSAGEDGPQGTLLVRPPEGRSS